MGLFHRSKKKKNSNENINFNFSNADNRCSDSNVTEEDIKRLSSGAGAIIGMLNKVFTTAEGIDIRKSLIFASGLAGYACHSAVKAIDPALFVVVETNNGGKYYFGDAVNKFLLENKYSVRSFCEGIYMHMPPQTPEPDCLQIVRKIASSVGDANYKIWNTYKPEDVYKEIQACWNDIYHNMTEVYCNKPSEWPILFAIVLQNIMKMAMEVAPKDEVYQFAMECSCCISKMDDNSIPNL